MRLLSIGMETSPNHLERVQMLLRHHERKPYSKLFHYVDYLAVIGRMYRAYEKLGTCRILSQFAVDTECHHDAWYGLLMIRHHILPHLNVRAATPDLPPQSTPEQLAQWLPQALRDELDAKFEVLLMSTRQLYLFNDGQVGEQGCDVPAYQEIFTSAQVLVASFWNAMLRMQRMVSVTLASHMSPSLFQRLLAGEAGKRTNNAESMGQLFSLCTAFTEKLDAALLPVQRLLMLGNIVAEVDIDFNCPQPSGWVVQAEHLNFYRFFEQLRCVHRGATIASMRSSEVRRYPCEAYGFLCMVHTPDGEDCGVLNHLSVATILSESIAPDSAEAQRLAEWIAEALPRLRRADNTALTDRLLGTMPVWFDGHILGYVLPDEAVAATARLRELKLLTSRRLVDENGVVRRKDATPLHTIEVVHIPPHTKEMAGLFIFSDHGRLMRPIQKIETAGGPRGADDLPFPLMYTGTWEQSWLDVAGVSSELADAVVQLRKKFEYMEQNGSNIVSLTSTTIPFFEFNCSPRNLFQCGLSKQSTGTQLQSLGWRRDAKLFRMYVPQRYISRTLPMDYYGLDDVSLGVNAVVAILAYTGYDMDDAVILNSTASQRGMLHADITVGKIATASGKDDGDDATYVFNNMLANGERFSAQLEANGLPPKRTYSHLHKEVNFTTDHSYPSLCDDRDVYCIAKRCQRVDPMTNNMTYEYSDHMVKKWSKFDKGENGWVHQVIPLAFNGPDPVSVLLIFRIPRPPTVGDKFSSRHGQKGTLPLHIRAHDLPFSSQTGITPDVIINPHAFPSRMTVGMVLEIMTAKVGAIEGRFMDNSAWSVCDETPRVAETIGAALVKSGYNRYGREKFVDGISGEEMEADVFVGISGYQRLRHMVNDKWQARARTDPFKYRAVTKTGQPVKGRKSHGGVRVGEMERDALLSYGMSEVVLDRLLHVSDKTKAFVCTGCGSLLSIVERHATNLSTWKCCTFCGAGRTEDTDTIAMVEVPHVLRLWVAELTGIGIRVALRTEA
ncbi:DNA-directed RNA polymerase I subunit RPA2 [Strigomonas culicis]|uniref:DNA-directed RNA polymerase subunit beta n=1 Tax=Strigomonas culicis TaxID=28005 RepID=S9UFJ3_9TRYP|nr:DNA-directed RNA polymerase I subunit RPA2 [Strigomonas culicis]|eukprot:EPY27499.1 DNA-directed RNA polymerase I subunit RPA2 [Strigomonas culicis]